MPRSATSKRGSAVSLGRMKTSSKKPIKLDDLDGVELTASQAFWLLNSF